MCTCVCVCGVGGGVLENGIWREKKCKDNERIFERERGREGERERGREGERERGREGERETLFPNIVDCS